MAPAPEAERTARNIVLSGQVQGVGFRPFVWRLAQKHHLDGWVKNGSGRVFIHIEGHADDLAVFERALIAEPPPLANPRLESAEDVAVEGTGDFRILASGTDDDADVHLPPDLFCCEYCSRELTTPGERRYRYPFTNCTQCGPRYTIIKALPYDRTNTSMAGYPLCARCRAEYEDPRDRRHHAQPLACPDCGPTLTFRMKGEAERFGDDALQSAIALLRRGGIVAAKGIGGYHLLCNPEDGVAVARLRARKHRPHKPLAVMFPDLGTLRRCVALDDAETRSVTDVARPIVLARKRAGLSDGIAPGLGELGVFLPYSPLHHLLLAGFGGPLVATSGNISGEPVITDNDEAEHRLDHVADGFLHHDRLIVRPADDSVVRVMAGRARPIRIGRGLAPREIQLPVAFPEPTIAVGGHMKGAIALGWDRRVVVSPHIGELDSPRSLAVFQQVIGDLSSLYRVELRRIVCDAHPGYASTRWAKARGLPIVNVQHHRAHASAVAGEHPEIARWLVFTWDGVGLGENGELWGGETFAGRPGAWQRVASLRRFRLTGGDAAGREPWRSAAALMWEAGYQWSPSVNEAVLAEQAWRKGLNTARCSSVGRLFDAAAALVLGIDSTSFEGQGPMALESAATANAQGITLPQSRDEDGVVRADWSPLLPMLTDSRLPPATRAATFHESMAHMLVDQVQLIAQSVQFDAVGLGGGVFQNRRLAERVIALLSARGIQVFLPELVPANDGGLAFGQLIETMERP